MAIPQVLGPYQLKARIAVGGQSEVWLGLRVGPGGFKRRCAIKLLQPPTSSDPNARKAFIAEARLMASFNHPNLVAVTDLGEIEDPVIAYSVMPYISGLDLSTVLHKSPQIPLNHATWIISKVLLALDYAHTLTDERGRSLGVTHRDVSPENILIGFDGQIYLIDFGIALSAINPRNTRVHVVKGKLEFLSPEQANASPRIDRRTDIYSTGLVLYVAITGKNPLTGDPDTALERARNPEFHRISDTVPIPNELESVWATMVRRVPKERPKDAKALARHFMTTLHRMDPTYDELTFEEWIKNLLSEEIENENIFLSKISQGTQIIDSDADLTTSRSARERSHTPVLDDTADTVQMESKFKRVSMSDKTRDDLADILAELEDIYDPTKP